MNANGTELREVTRTRTLMVEERTSDGLVEVTDVGDDEGSIALMAEMGWVRADVHGEGAKVFAVKLEVPAEFTPEIAEKLRAQGLNGSPGFTPAGELEVGTKKEVIGEDEEGFELDTEYLDKVVEKMKPKKTLSEKLDELLPRELGKHGNGSVAGVAATVAVLVELLSSELGRRF